MSQGWILPDGSMSSNEMEYNTPWLFEDPISDDLPQAAGTSSAFVDPRVAAVSKTGALTDYINAGTGGGSSSRGTNTPWLPGESVEWSGGLGLPSWAANGLAQAGKFGLGAMGVPSFITGPLGAYASSLLGDENSTAESVRNKVGNSIIGVGLSALNPIAGIANTVLGAFGFDAMRGLSSLGDNTDYSSQGGHAAGFFTKPSDYTGYTPGQAYEPGALQTATNVRGTDEGSQFNGYSPGSSGSSSSSTGGFNQPSSSSGGGWTSASSGSAYSSPSSDSSSYSNPSSSYGGW